MEIDLGRKLARRLPAAWPKEEIDLGRKLARRLLAAWPKEYSGLINSFS